MENVHPPSAFSGDFTAYKKRITYILKVAQFLQVLKGIQFGAGTTFIETFLANAHNPDFPLTLVVNDRGSRQKAVPDFLQCCLSFVRVPDLLSARNSDEGVEFLEPFH